MKFKYYKFGSQKGLNGFILPMTLFVCAIILAIATGISIVLTKEIYFSKLSRESQLAYYAADTAMMCAIMIDERYLDYETGIGIFPYNDTSMNTVFMNKIIDGVNPNIELEGTNGIKCATAPIFSTDDNLSDFTVSSFQRTPTEVGKKSIFFMRMDLGNGTNRCASVIVNKTIYYRQIIARGFSACPGTSSNVIERAVINTTEVQ